MKKKYLNTLVALVLLGVLAGTIAYWEKRAGKESGKSETTPQEKILALESSHIQAFTIRPKDGGPFTARREGGTWSIVNPRQLAADQSAVSSFLDNLTSASVDGVAESNPTSLKDFGLDPPAFTVEAATDAKPSQLTLLLGDETPTGGGVYAQVKGQQRVITLASYLRSSLGKTLFDLRNKRAVTLDLDQVHRIEVNSKDKHWTLAKNPEGVWDLVLPPPVRADRWSATNLVDRLRNASIETVAAEEKKDLARFGLNSPALRVTLTGPSGSQTLVLGKKDKEGDRTFAMNSAVQPVFTLSSDFLTQFRKDPADLRDKDLFSFSTFDAKRVEVETPKDKRVFEKLSDKWKQTAPNAKDLASDKVETLLSRLRDLRADSFPKEKDLAPLGLTNPAFKFQVRYGEKNQTESVEAAKVGDHAYARRTTDALASEVSKSALEDVEKALNEL